MKLQIPYNTSAILVEVPDERVLAVVEPHDVRQHLSTEELVRKALEQPLGNETFQQFLDAEGSLLVLVNDGTRPTPTAQILDVIADDLDRCKALFLVATGVHRAPTDAEFLSLFGRHYERFKDRIYVHDAKKQEDMVYLGTAAHGTALYIHKMGTEADKILVIGSVEPHYFAGYTGGRKSFLPGIASYSAIEQNHRYALDPRARALALEGNPVHEDMVEALHMIHTHTFSIMTVLKKDRQLYEVTAGDMDEAFAKAVEKAHEVYVVDIPQRADIVVTVATHPMDVDLYQAQKAMDNAKLALKEGGTMILVAACPQGLGDTTFVTLLSSCETPASVLQRIAKDYTLGYHKAAKMAEIFENASVYAVTELDDELLKSIFITPSHSLQETLDEAFRHHGETAKVLFLLDGCITVPQVRQDGYKSV